MQTRINVLGNCFNFSDSLA